ncbi:DMT family transporter [Roseibium sp.]|uniref:DMT family transporter n=1 Tax=Roseibium sp. TaxID=1936156 RepID=UPI003A9787B0
MIATALKYAGRPFGNAFVLLTLTALFFGGNTVAGRLAIGEVSPMAVVMLRWVIVSLVLTISLRHRLRAEWPIIRQHLGKMALMAVFGFVGFNSFFYVAAKHTNAVNLGIIQGSIPVLVLIGTVFLFQAKIRALQVLGILATLAGVAVVASHGDLSTLASLTLNPGDGIMLIACLFYTGYTLALRNRPPISGLVFFTILSIIAAFATLPLVGYEILTNTVQWPATPKGWLVVLYISLFPSCLAQIFFIRGVEAIGPARAGVFINLVPVFAAILAVAILGEDFRFDHGLAMVLVLGGIWLSEKKSRS